MKCIRTDIVAFSAMWTENAALTVKNGLYHVIGARSHEYITLLSAMHPSYYIGWTGCVVEDVIEFKEWELENDGPVLTSGPSPLSQEILSR